MKKIIFVNYIKKESKLYEIIQTKDVDGNFNFYDFDINEFILIKED